MDTLAVRLAVPLIGPAKVFHLLGLRPAGRTNKRTAVLLDRRYELTNGVASCCHIYCADYLIGHWRGFIAKSLFVRLLEDHAGKRHRRPGLRRECLAVVEMIAAGTVEQVDE